ncbi:MAG: SLC13 family permease [Pseudomonadota bacterium]
MSPISATALILLAVLYFLVRRQRAIDLVIWIGVALLLVVPVINAEGQLNIGILSPAEALAGLANEGVVTIAALFIVAAGLRNTGALRLIVENSLGTPADNAQARQRLVWPTAVMSAFLNNTPLMAMLIPVADDWAKRHRLALSQLLMPLSFASILGGACTLIGTSTNLVVNGWLVDEAGMASLGIFEITVVAGPLAVAGIVFVSLFADRLLPARSGAFHDLNNAREYVVEMLVEKGGPLVGQSIEQAGLRGLPGLFLVEIQRAEEVLAAVSSNVALQDGDRLVFAGIVDSVVDLQRIPGLLPATDQVFKLEQSRRNRMLVEAVVSDSFPLLGTTIREGQFRTHYNAAVIAVARNGERIKKKIGDIQLAPGDTLLLEARVNFIEQQRNRRDFYLVSAIETPPPIDYSRSSVAIAIILSIITTVATGFLSILQAALAAAALMLVTRCVTAQQARRAVDWEVILVIAGAIALGRALAVSGLAAQISEIVLATFGASPTLLLAAIYGLTAVMAALISAKAAAVLMLPIAMAGAVQMNLAFMPFAIAVMLAAATTVATPIGYPTNLMVYGPGGYRYSDYLRLGIPLTLFLWGLAIVLVPLAWPFTG